MSPLWPSTSRSSKQSFILNCPAGVWEPNASDTRRANAVRPPDALLLYKPLQAGKRSPEPDKMALDGTGE